MHHEEWAERLHSGLDQLRERTAGALGPDEEEGVLRRIGLLEHRLEGIGDRLSERLDDLEDRQDSRWGEVIASGRRTTWPRRLFWVLFGAGVGFAAAYLADPDRGRSRRAQLSDQLAARARDVSGDLANQAKITADRARGAVIESVTDALPEDVPDDPKLLEARIKSEVFGGRDDVTDVVLRVDAPGQVALKGTVPSPVTERELVSAVAEVEGVIDVRSELSSRSS